MSTEDDTKMDRIPQTELAPNPITLSVEKKEPELPDPVDDIDNDMINEMHKALSNDDESEEEKHAHLETKRVSRLDILIYGYYQQYVVEHRQEPALVWVFFKYLRDKKAKQNFRDVQKWWNIKDKPRKLAKKGNTNEQERVDEEKENQPSDKKKEDKRKDMDIMEIDPNLIFLQQSLTQQPSEDIDTDSDYDSKATKESVSIHIGETAMIRTDVDGEKEEKEEREQNEDMIAHSSTMPTTTTKHTPIKPTPIRAKSRFSMLFKNIGKKQKRKRSQSTPQPDDDIPNDRYLQPVDEGEEKNSDKSELTLGVIDSIKKTLSQTKSHSVLSMSIFNSSRKRVAPLKEKTLLDVDEIRNKLATHELYVKEDDLKSILSGYECKEDLIGDVCDGYNEVNDQHIKLSQLLSQMEYPWSQRQRFYDIVLKDYFVKEDLEQHNFIKILRKTIENLKLDIDLDECQRLANTASLDGSIFDINDEYDKRVKRFIKVFKSMGVDKNKWNNVYDDINKWTSNDYTKTLDFEEIREILSMNHFMTKNEIEILKTSLNAASTLICGDETDEKYDVGIKCYDQARLMSELCDLFECDDDEKSSHQLQQILVEELGFTDPQQRKQFYDILLHKYFKEHQLNTENFVKILIKNMDEMDDEDVNEVRGVCAKHRLNGLMFVKGHKDCKPSTKFASLFKLIKKYDRKKFCKMYQTMKRWKSKEYKTRKRKEKAKRPRSDAVNADEHWFPDLVRNKEEENEYDPLPKYIYKCLWYQSWDEKIEALIDHAVFTLCTGSQSTVWNDESFVDLIYSEYINKYYAAVRTVFEETGKEKFFEQFVKEHYKREIRIWRIRSENTIVLRDKGTLCQKIQEIDFNEFDFDGNGRLDKEEFRKCFVANGLEIEQDLVNEIFQELDKDGNDVIEIKEFETFNENKGKKGSDNEEESFCYFDWNEDAKEYQLFPQNLFGATQTPILNDDRFKWMRYLSIEKKKENRFKKYHPREHANGYWEHIDTNVKEQTSEDGCLPQNHLDKIFAVLNYYYKSKTDDDNTPLASRNTKDNKMKIRFMIIEQGNDINNDINNYEYELIWWNQKGRYETNAFTIQNLTVFEDFRRKSTHRRYMNEPYSPSDEEKEAPRPFICYLRFNAKHSGLQWKWYDNDNSEYKPMGVYKDDNGKDQVYTELIDQLEASFLGNIRDNFQAQRFQNRFNYCLLPELATFVGKYLQKPGANDYVFAVTFRDEESTRIDNIEQIGYTQKPGGSSFPRNISRFINGRNSLNPFLSTVDAFVRRWKRMYKLYTEEQQQYFWCFVLSIVAKIKFIDIEFENQLVLLPLADNQIQKENTKLQSIISELIDYDDVEGEQIDASYFEGSILPPLDVWQHIEKDRKSNRKMSKCGILRKAKRKNQNKGDKGDKHDYKWMMNANERPEHRFTENQAILLRMVDCIRTFVLEFELGSTPLWPWYQNSKFYNVSNEGYNKLMQKYNLFKGYDIHDSYPIEANSNQQQKVSRHKRKWCALLLLNDELQRNLNYIRTFLDHVLDELVDETCLDHTNTCTEHKDNSDNMQLRQKMDILEQRINALHKMLDTKDNVKTDQIKLQNIKTFIENKIQKNQQFWIQKRNIMDIKPNLDHVTLDIDKYKLPLLEQFMRNCFIDPDKKMFECNMERKKDTSKTYFYRIFMDFWRNVPDFWTYSHDILLLELVLRHGINCEAITNNITQSEEEYASRVHILNNNNLVSEHPLFSFQTWCKLEINVLHRLRYITTTIVNELNRDIDKQERTVFSIFSEYQKRSHLEFMKRREWEYDINEDDKELSVSGSAEKDVVDERDGNLQILTIDKDPYVVRNIDRELFESLQAFDLMKYGKSVTKFMVEKLQREPTDSHYHVLGQLLYSIPDPIAIQILKDSKHTLKKAKPQQLKDLCLQIEAGSIFKTNADLSIAQFFGDLALSDLVQTETWKEYSKEFEIKAFTNISCIKNDHMMFVLLTIPLSSHHGKCLIQLAQEQHRALFLNVPRISAVVDHIYASGYLKPHDSMQTGSLTFTGMFHNAFCHPFLFYFTAQGYHWVEGILYAEYLMMIYCYAYLCPRLTEIQETNKKWLIVFKVFEVTFWSNSLGSILYEVGELAEKGCGEYFNLAVMGEDNVLDAVISVIWIVLFSLRVAIYYEWDEGTSVMKSFVFLFALQILFITFRAFKIVNSSEYFGTMLRIIKLMLQEFVKFALIFLMIMIACLFGLWFISIVDNDDEQVDDEQAFWKEGLPNGLLSIFEVFIGTTEISGFHVDPIGTLFLVISTIFGTLLLLNLLIATMASKYDQVREQAHKDVILNKTELSFDLLRRSRHMPPPLNIALYIIALIVLFLNFIISLCNPKWNVFAKIHYDTFENMKMYHFWKCKHKKCEYNDEDKHRNREYTFFCCSCKCAEKCCRCQCGKKQNETPNHDTSNTDKSNAQKINVEPLKYFASFTRCDVIKYCCGCKRAKVHHSHCYGDMKLFSKTVDLTVNGITMSKYFEVYQKEKKRLITRNDKIMLNQLTANTLFCPHCYQGFTNTEDANIQKKEFVSALTPLVDYISALIFVAIPIAWFPILIIIGAGAIKDYLFGIPKSNETDKNYSHQDYDRNYFPQFIPSKVLYTDK